MGQGLKNGKLGIERTRDKNSEALESSALPREKSPNAKQSVDDPNSKKAKMICM